MDPTVSSPVSGPELEERGSRPRGVLGALIGALVGAIPWFLASSFTGWFIGWLGFLIAYAACFGYQKLGGYRSTRFAMGCVITVSVLALFLAEIGSFIYAVYADADCQALAAYYSVSPFVLALVFLQEPSVWGDLLPNLLIGMGIGALGVFSARSNVLKYTDPEKAAQAQTAGPAAEPFYAGLTLPPEFTVRNNKSASVIGWICTVAFAVLFVVFLAACVAEGFDPSSDSIVLVFFVLFAFLGVWLIFYSRARIEVTGSTLIYYNGFGKHIEFQASDIGSLSLASLNGTSKLYGRDGQVLAKFNSGMKNAPLLMQYLSEHNIGLRG